MRIFYCVCSNLLFNPCPGITMAIDDVITTTADVITAIDVIIYIDLKGKVMCCKKVVCFLCQQILHLKFIFWNYNRSIDANIITYNKNMLLVKVSLYLKFISLKRGSWLQSCKMTGHEGACFIYKRDCSKA